MGTELGFFLGGMFLLLCSLTDENGRSSPCQLHLNSTFTQNEDDNQMEESEEWAQRERFG